MKKNMELEIKEGLFYIYFWGLFLLFSIIFFSNLLGFFIGLNLKCSETEKRIITDNYITGASWKLVCIRK